MLIRRRTAVLDVGVKESFALAGALNGSTFAVFELDNELAGCSRQPFNGISAQAAISDSFANKLLDRTCNLIGSAIGYSTPAIMVGFSAGSLPV